MSVADAPDFITVMTPLSRSSLSVSSVANPSSADFASIIEFTSRTAEPQDAPLHMSFLNIATTSLDSIAAFRPVPMPSERTM